MEVEEKPKNVMLIVEGGLPGEIKSSFPANRFEISAHDFGEDTARISETENRPDFFILVGSDGKEPDRLRDMVLTVDLPLVIIRTQFDRIQLEVFPGWGEIADLVESMARYFFRRRCIPAN